MQNSCSTLRCVIVLKWMFENITDEKTTFVQIMTQCCQATSHYLSQVVLEKNIRRLTHWGRVTHICVSKLTIIGSDNGLSPSRRQALIWTNDGILLIRTFRTHFSEIVIEIHTFSFKKMRLKGSSAKRRPFCLGLNVLSVWVSYSYMSMTLKTLFRLWIL